MRCRLADQGEPMWGGSVAVVRSLRKRRACGLGPAAAMVADGTAALLASVDRVSFMASLLAPEGTAGGSSARRALPADTPAEEGAAFRESGRREERRRSMYSARRG